MGDFVRPVICVVKRKLEMFSRDPVSDCRHFIHVRHGNNRPIIAPGLACHRRPFECWQNFRDSRVDSIGKSDIISDQNRLRRLVMLCLRQ